MDLEFDRHQIVRASAYCVVATDLEHFEIDSECFSGGNRVNESIVLDLRGPAASGQIAAYGIGDPKEHPWLKWLALKAHEQ